MGETEGESVSPCMGGGERLGLTDACIRKSCANWPSNEYEAEERAEGEKSSNDACRECIEVILLMPYRLGRFLIRGGPGSLSTVVCDNDDRRPRLCMSENEDIEWSSSKSRFRAFVTRSSDNRQPRSLSTSAKCWSSGCGPNRPAAASRVVEVPFFPIWPCTGRIGPEAEFFLFSNWCSGLGATPPIHSMSPTCVFAITWLRFCMTARAWSRPILACNLRLSFSASICKRWASFLFNFLTSSSCWGPWSMPKSRTELSVLDVGGRLVKLFDIGVVSSTGGKAL